MAKDLPKISAVSVNYEAVTGISVHLTTDTAGEMDVTVTHAQYRSIRNQIVDNGFAYVPLGERTL